MSKHEAITPEYDATMVFTFDVASSDVVVTYGCICGFRTEGTSQKEARKALLDHLIETDTEDMTTRVWHRLDDRLTAVDVLAKGIEDDLALISRAVDHEAATIPASTERLVAISHNDWVRLLQALSNHPKALLEVAALNIMCEDIVK